MEPAVGPAVVAGVLLEKDGQVSSTEALCRAVFRAAVRAGATFRFGATAQALLWSHDRVCGVRLANGFAEATWTVLAAGPWTGQLLGNTKVCAITAQSSEALLVDGVARPLRILSSDRAYIAPRPDGQVMVGIEEVVDRFYSSSTLGGVGRVAANAIAVLPSLSLARLVQTWAAVRPYTFDHRPVIGPVEQADGLLVAAGHHYGIAQAPETARLIASIICDAPGERLEVPPDVLPGRGLVGQ